AGILHGDIKPENIMLTAAGRVKILDFGVARRLSRVGAELATETLETLKGPLSGTPAYMAPEVLLMKEADGRADIFSLGVVFYEMLGGRQPFRTDSFAGTVGRILHEEPPSVADLNRGVPQELARIVRKMLAKDPAQRYASVHEVIADLQAFQKGKPISAKPLEGEKKRRKRGATAGAIAVTIVVVAIAAGLARHRVAQWFTASSAGAAPAEQLPDIKNLVV